MYSAKLIQYQPESTQPVKNPYMLYTSPKVFSGLLVVKLMYISFYIPSRRRRNHHPK